MSLEKRAAVQAEPSPGGGRWRALALLALAGLLGMSPLVLRLGFGFGFGSGAQARVAAARLCGMRRFVETSANVILAMVPTNRVHSGIGAAMSVSHAAA